MTPVDIWKHAKQAGLRLTLRDGRVVVEPQDTPEARAYLNRFRNYLEEESMKEFVRATENAEFSTLEEVAEAYEKVAPGFMARLEFASVFYYHLEQEAAFVGPLWLQAAYWALVADAMNAFCKVGIEPETFQAVQKSQDKAGLLERAIKGWADAYAKKEKVMWYPYDADMGELNRECDLWAWRAYMVALALGNPGASPNEVDPWKADLKAWWGVLKRVAPKAIRWRDEA